MNDSELWNHAIKAVSKLTESAFNILTCYTSLNKFWFFIGPSIEQGFFELKTMQNDLGKAATHQDKDEEESIKQKMYLFKFSVTYFIQN